MKVTFQSKAWLDQHSATTPAELQTEKGARTCYVTPLGMSRQGWTFVGDATVELEVPDMQTLVDNKVASLREQAADIRAQATARCTQIEGQIQQLLCIENSPAGAQ